MKKKILVACILIFIFFCFFILLKGLDNSNVYIPDENYGKKISSFKAKKLFNDQIISSDILLTDSNFYIINIWASWCVPCRAEHKHLMQLSDNKLIKIIGINYRDSSKNAKKFVKEFGNPFSEIIIDIDGTISINLGAYGIPETYLIDNNKRVLKKFVGALNFDSIKEIENLLK